MIVIEMNPRVSRSSALASKATGFPIAKIAAKLAIGYTLDELKNDITRVTPASFEPTIDYVVVKWPRFAFEKFPSAQPVLGPQMKSVGEAMSIGRTFREALGKAIRSLETGRAGFDLPFAGQGDDLAVVERAIATASPALGIARSKPARPVSSERIALPSASRNVRPIAIASPTDFICGPSTGFADGNFSNANRGHLTTT